MCWKWLSVKITKYGNSVLQGNSVLLIVNWSQSQKVQILLLSPPLSLTANPCHFTSHKYLFVRGRLSPTLKERPPALFHEHIPLDLYIYNWWLVRDNRKKQVKCCRMMKWFKEKWQIYKIRLNPSLDTFDIAVIQVKCCPISLPPVQ